MSRNGRCGARVHVGITSKAMVNRLLQDLARGGYIALSRDSIVLLKQLPPKW